MKYISKRSIFAGAVFAPLIAPLVFFICISIASVIRSSAAIGLNDWKAVAAASAIFVLPVSYLATWIFGVPFFFWLRSKARLTANGVCFGAIIFGVISTWIFQWLGKTTSLSLDRLLLGALVGAFMALCVAVIFCSISGVLTRAPRFK